MMGKSFISGSKRDVISKMAEAARFVLMLNYSLLPRLLTVGSIFKDFKSNGRMCREIFRMIFSLLGYQLRLLIYPFNCLQMNASCLP